MTDRRGSWYAFHRTRLRRVDDKLPVLRGGRQGPELSEGGGRQHPSDRMYQSDAAEPQVREIHAIVFPVGRSVDQKPLPDVASTDLVRQNASPLSLPSAADGRPAAAMAPLPGRLLPSNVLKTRSGRPTPLRQSLRVRPAYPSIEIGATSDVVRSPSSPAGVAAAFPPTHASAHGERLPPLAAVGTGVHSAGGAASAVGSSHQTQNGNVAGRRLSIVSVESDKSDPISAADRESPMHRGEGIATLGPLTNAKLPAVSFQSQDTGQGAGSSAARIPFGTLSRKRSSFSFPKLSRLPPALELQRQLFWERVKALHAMHDAVDRQHEMESGGLASAAGRQGLGRAEENRVRFRASSGNQPTGDALPPADGSEDAEAVVSSLVSTLMFRKYLAMRNIPLADMFSVPSK